MNSNFDNSQDIQQQVRVALASMLPLNICGGNSKTFYGNQPVGDKLDVSTHTGIISYEPTELVITARTGTKLNEIEAVLAAQHQMLAFEPPAYTETATIGGTIACNQSGPRRPFAGAARDFMLGCKIINGKSELLIFGGQVMKNVAGYDVSRLMTGAVGTLGVIMDVSLKVLPKPETELTLVFSASVTQSLHNASLWQRLPLPVSAISFDGEKMFVRVSGTDKAVKQAQHKLGGDVLNDSSNFWRDLNQHKTDFFKSTKNLWRVSVPSNTPALSIAGEWFYDWGGAQRWVTTSASAESVRAAAQTAGGHATLYRGDADIEKFQALPAGLMKIHQQLKNALDPHGLFNRGRLYRDM